MRRKSVAGWVLLAGLFLFATFARVAHAKLHIVHVEGPPFVSAAHRYGSLRAHSARESYKAMLEARHDEILRTVVGEEGRKVYSYSHVVNAFAAHLHPHEVEALRGHGEVVRVQEDRIRRTQTVHTPQYLGLEQPQWGLWNRTRPVLGQGVVIGVLDTGIWPEHPSFRDDGMPPPPAKWRGICDDRGPMFEKSSCNNKLIGARFFAHGFEVYANTSVGDPRVKDYRSPRDAQGHGSHVAAIAAGTASKAELLGNDLGIAEGLAPAAHLAVYKVCWGQSPIEYEENYRYQYCADSDILAAVDAAIQDGVDVLSLSIGVADGEVLPLYEDTIAIASLYATLANIIVVAAAGNGGPSRGTVSNAAPWQVTVGAGTCDRVFENWLELGDGQVLKGVSFTGGTDKFYPLINGEVADDANSEWWQSSFCLPGSLDPAKVKGRILVCQVDNGVVPVVVSQVAQQAGATGLVLINDVWLQDYLFDEQALHFIPTVRIGQTDGASLLVYLNSTSDPMARIGPTRGVTGQEAPRALWFSSAGPNGACPDILKPDVIAPGDNVLSAWTLSPLAAPATQLASDKRRMAWQAMSGTSLATPHVAGIAALIKSFHPDWPPSWIHSALVTTASAVTNRGKPIGGLYNHRATPFDYGAGEVRPNSAAHPGLVYELGPGDYVTFLCTRAGGAKLSDTHLLRDVYSCPKQPFREMDLNYPSFSFSKLIKPVTVRRTVVSVGKPGRYQVAITHPPGVHLSVDPEVMDMTDRHQRMSYTVTVTPLNVTSRIAQNDAGYTFGSLTWHDGRHTVRSPVAVRVVALARTQKA